VLGRGGYNSFERGVGCWSTRPFCAETLWSTTLCAPSLRWPANLATVLMIFATGFLSVSNPGCVRSFHHSSREVLRPGKPKKPTKRTSLSQSLYCRYGKIEFPRSRPAMRLPDRAGRTCLTHAGFAPRGRTVWRSILGGRIWQALIFGAWIGGRRLRSGRVPSKQACPRSTPI